MENKVQLIHSLRTLINNQHNQELVDNFCKKIYHKKFDIVSEQNWHTYTGFEIISEDEIKIKYSYGAGDIEYDDSFNVKIR